MVKWLGLWAATAKGGGLALGWETKTSCLVQKQSTLNRIGAAVTANVKGQYRCLAKGIVQRMCEVFVGIGWVGLLRMLL